MADLQSFHAFILASAKNRQCKKYCANKQYGIFCAMVIILRIQKNALRILRNFSGNVVLIDMTLHMKVDSY